MGSTSVGNSTLVIKFALATTSPGALSAQVDDKTIRSRFNRLHPDLEDNGKDKNIHAEVGQRRQHVPDHTSHRARTTPLYLLGDEAFEKGTKPERNHDPGTEMNDYPAQ